jgi:hypothetical protein
MYAKSVRVSLKGEHGFDTVTLAKAIHGFSPITLSTCITIARALLSGQEWEPEPSQIRFTNEEALSPDFYWGWFNFQIEPFPDP